ncbi:MAG: CheR family methyltransferase [Pelovirga sp.]
MALDSFQAQLATITDLFSNTRLRHDFVATVVDKLQQWTRCHCVGIRIVNPDDFMPYEAYVGFSQEFWDHENWLSLRDHQCGCIRIVNNEILPFDKPLLTENGSILSNDLQAFGASLTAAEASRYRGKCVECGFGSLAVVPIRQQGKIIGLIHLADKRTNLLPPAMIEAIEALTVSIAEMIERFSAEDGLGVAAQPETSKAADSFPIVGIGASAGGLSAFKAFFSGMPTDADPGMAFVLVQHLAPDHKSVLTDLIRGYTPMQVFEVEDGMEVRINCVYIIPPNCDMALLNGTLQLLEPTAPLYQRLPVDFFFRSLAQDQRERSIGVVLTGCASDGTLGVRAIKGEGGMVMVQNPESAEFDGMPRSAIATGLVDYELEPAAMAAQLMAYKAYAFGKPPLPATPPPKTMSTFKKIFVLLRAHTGHDFSQYRSSTIQRRIERRMAVHQIKTMDVYVKFLQQSPKEVEALFRDILISLTHFFRDPEAFHALEEQIIPKLFAGKDANATIRIWVPGCSTGEEAYSLAILMAERQEALKKSFKVQIFATDIDSRVIAVARAGIYPASIAADVTPERLERFFAAEPGESAYRIHKNIRDMLVFSEQSVIKNPHFCKLDLISCRNLLIYLGNNLQKQLIPSFHSALNPGGYLFLGTSETLRQFGDLFSVLDPKQKIFQRREDPLIAPCADLDTALKQELSSNEEYLQVVNEELRSVNEEVRSVNAELQAKVTFLSRTNNERDSLLAGSRRYQELVETVNDWVWEVNQDGVYTYASPGIKNLLGYVPEEIIGKTPFDFMLDGEKDRVANEFKKILTMRKAFQALENTKRHKYGHLVVLETSGVPYFDERGLLLGYRGIDRDISERKQAKEALIQANRELDAFVYTVSHDLRSYLTPIIGYAGVLKETCQERIDKQSLDCLEEIENQGYRMLELMEDLLLLAKAGHLPQSTEPVDLIDVVEDVLADMGSLITKAGVIIERHPMPTLRVPKSFLTQIFCNLLGNAIRYAGSDGNPIEIGGERRGEFVRLFVRDHGPGVAESERCRIFETFYRGVAGRKTSGTGVGLAVVQKISRVYGGRSWVEETPGGGSSFWVELMDVQNPRE